MAAKFDKEPKSTKKITPEKSLGRNKTIPKSKKELEDDEDGLDSDEIESSSAKKTLKGSTKNKAEDIEEDETDVEAELDTVNKAEDDDNWDPDFEEFDLPKSKSGKKITGGKKGSKDEDDDDFKLDEEFKDMFGKPSSKSDDNEDDF